MTFELCETWSASRQHDSISCCSQPVVPPSTRGLEFRQSLVQPDGLDGLLDLVCHSPYYTRAK